MSSSSSVLQERKQSTKAINKKRKTQEVIPADLEEHEDENNSYVADTAAAASGAILGRKKYNVINEDVRKKIIARLTDEQGTNIKEVAGEFGLKLSTCKAILQVYQKEGRIGKKATRDRKSKIVSTILIVRIDPMNPTSSTITPYVHVSEAMTSSNKKPDEEGQFQHNDLLKEAFKSAQEHIKTVIKENAQDIFLGGSRSNSNNSDPPVPVSSQQDLEMAFIEAQRDAIKVLLKENPVVQAGGWAQRKEEQEQLQQQNESQQQMIKIRQQTQGEQITENQIPNGKSRIYSSTDLNSNNITTSPPVIHGQFAPQINRNNNFNNNFCSSCGGSNNTDNFTSCRNCSNCNNNKQILPVSHPTSTCSTTSSSSSSSSSNCFVSGNQLLKDNPTNNSTNTVITQHQSQHHHNAEQAFQQLHPQQPQPYIAHRIPGEQQQQQHQQQQQSSVFDPGMAFNSATIQTHRPNNVLSHNHTNPQLPVLTTNYDEVPMSHSEQPKKAQKDKGNHANHIIKRRTNISHKGNTGKNNNNHQINQVSPFASTSTNLQSQQQSQPQRQPLMNGSVTFNTATTTSQSQDCTFSSLYSPNQYGFIQQYSDSQSMSTINASSPAVTPFLNPFTLGSQSPVLLPTQNSNNNITNNFQSSLISPLNIAQSSPFAPTKSSQFSLNQGNFQDEPNKNNTSYQNEQSPAAPPSIVRDTSLSQHQQQYNCFY